MTTVLAETPEQHVTPSSSAGVRRTTVRRIAGSEGVLYPSLPQTSRFLKEIEEEFGWGDRRFLSFAAARIILHALRDRLTVQEASDFASQLPLLLKGVFFEGWNPAAVPRRIDAAEFRDEIRSQFQYSLDGSLDDLMRVVVRALGQFIS